MVPSCFLSFAASLVSCFMKPNTLSLWQSHVVPFLVVVVAMCSFWMSFDDVLFLDSCIHGGIEKAADVAAAQLDRQLLEQRTFVSFEEQLYLASVGIPVLRSVQYWETAPYLFSPFFFAVILINHIVHFLACPSVSPTFGSGRRRKHQEQLSASTEGEKVK